MKILALGIVSALCLSMVSFSSCTSGITYENAERYTAGGATLTETVLDVDIAWVSGYVEIKHGDVEGVTFSETSFVNLSERTTLHYWLDGTTLRIQYAQSDGSLFAGDYPAKDLVVILPQEYALQGVEVEAISAGIHLNEVQAADVDLESVSGTIHATMSESTKKIDAESVSGNVTVTHSSADRFELKTTSGNIYFKTKATPKSGEVESVSGSVTLTFPDTATGFTVDVETVSGDFTSDLSMTKNGNRYVYGDGSSSFEVETVSGDISIEQVTLGATQP